MKKISLGLLAITSLVGCPDVDALGKLPPPIDVENALLVPSPEGILVFPISDSQTQPLEPPVGFFADPDDVGDLVQRPDQKIVATTLDPDLSEPEGFIFDTNGDISQRADNTLINLDTSPNLIAPISIAALSDNSVVISDFTLGRGVERFASDGTLIGPLTTALTFANPVGVVSLGADVLVLDPQQDPRLFRFGSDGTFKGAFAAESEVLSPLAAAKKDNTLFIIDSVLKAVFAFDDTGQLLDFVAIDQLGNPSDVDVLPNGFVVVADLGNEDVGIAPGLRVFGLAGNLVQQIPLTQILNDDALRISVVSNIKAHPVR
jgi:hypothetical protein